MTTVETVRGPVPAEELGFTLPHEHIFTKNPELEQNWPHPEWHEEAAIRRAIDALKALEERGVKTFVDLTVVGLGRYIPRIQQVAEHVDLNIVVATGLYTFRDLPAYFGNRGPGRPIDGRDPLEEFFIRDIAEGIGDTGVKAGMLKVATDVFGITPDIERVLAAAVVAHQETGVTITTHTNAEHRTGADQQKYFMAHGVSPEHLVIGHCGDSTDVDYLRSLMDNGSTIGLDRFGMEQVLDDARRIDMLVELVELGYADRLLLSHDAGVFSINTPPSWRAVHAPNWHYLDIPDRILPAIRERGVPEEAIHQMTVVNPARVLVGRRG